jgi:hypothetical protein
MTSMTAGNVRELFLANAQIVRSAIGEDVVARAWDEPSILEDQRVGGIAGHLARGGVWVVDDYLNAEIPDAPRSRSAAAYFAQSAEFLNANDHRLIRERGAQVAAQGHADVCAALDARLAVLTSRLLDEPVDRIVGVAGGVTVMTLDSYLETRIVEQVVHLDDLARSVHREPWTVPDAALSLALHVGIDVARLRHGGTETLRMLYRSRLDPVLPVL